MINNGLYKTMSNEMYHADKGSISTSLIKKMANTFAHADYALHSEFEQTAAMQLGTVFHDLVLEDGMGFEVQPDVNARTKAGKATLADFKELNEGKLIVKQEVVDTARMMRESVYKHTTASALLKSGDAEMSIFWDHKGQQLRCRPDFYNTANVVVDLKSAIDASPAGFAKAVANFGYDLQEAIYRDGVTTQLEVKDFVFIVTDNKPPHLTAVYRLKTEDVLKARDKYHRLLSGWKACNEFEYFTGYSDDIVTLDLPGWYK